MFGFTSAFFRMSRGEGLKERMNEIVPARQTRQIRLLQRRTSLSIYRLFIGYPWCHSMYLGLPTQLCVCVCVCVCVGKRRRKYVKKKDASTVQPHDLSCSVFLCFLKATKTNLMNAYVGDKPHTSLSLNSRQGLIDMSRIQRCESKRGIFYRLEFNQDS